MLRSGPARFAEGFDGNEDSARRFFQILLTTATLGAACPELAGSLSQGEIRLTQHEESAPGDKRENEEMLEPEWHA